MGKTNEDKSRMVTVRKGDVDPERVVREVHEIIKDFHTLAERMQDIVNNNEIPVGLFDVGVVVGVASAGSPDFTMTLGTRDGVVKASVGLMESVKEVLENDTSDESSKDSEKDN